MDLARPFGPDKALLRWRLARLIIPIIFLCYAAGLLATREQLRIWVALPFYLLPLSFAAGSALYAGFHGWRPEARRAWRWMGVGLVCWLVNEATVGIVTAAIVATPSASPVPGVAVPIGIYLASRALQWLGYLVVAAGLWLAGDELGPGRSSSPTLDLLMALVAVAAPAWVGIVRPAMILAGAVGEQISVAVTAALDLLLALPALRLLLLSLDKEGEAPKDMTLAMAGVLPFLLTEAGSVLLAVRGRYYGGHPIDLGWVAGFCLWGLGALRSALVPRPAAPAATTPLPRRRRMRGEMFSAALALTAVVTVFGLHTWAMMTGASPSTTNATLLALIVVCALMLARMFRLYRQVMRIERESDNAQTQRLIASMIAQSPVGTAILDARGHCACANQAALDMLGLPCDPTTDNSAACGQAVAGQQRLQAAVQRTLQTGEVGQLNLEMEPTPGSSPAGRPAQRILQTTLFPVRDDEGEVANVVLLQRDVTQERERELQLRRAQKLEAVEGLAGGIAHDFNNLLTAMTGYARFLRRGLPDTAPVRSDLAGMERAIERAAALTHRLLAFSRHQRLDLAVFDLNDMLAGMVGRLRGLLVEGIELDIRPGPSAGHVRADRMQIEQIVTNLVENARDAMPEGGRIAISTANTVLDQAYCAARPEIAPGPYVCLAITDQGHGMPAEAQARLFEPFFSTKDMGKGTGLGLAIGYGIVRQHEGDIQVYSEEGKGTTVRVYLPRVQGLGPDA